MPFDFQLLWPRNSPFASGIVAFLIALFVVWFFWWVRLMFRIWRSRRELSRCEIAVEKLIETSVTHDATPLTVQEVCEAALNSAEIAPAGHVGKHICTLFQAGLRDASFEIGELNYRTIEGVSGKETALRTMLSTFVIVGLLGTLVGIAWAVGVFGAETSPEGLLGRLPGAFTPSIWGVAFSIVGSLMLVWTRAYAGSFSTVLRANTMELLIPHLVPSHSERIDHAATRAVAAAQRVVEFAETIEARSEEVNSSLARAASSASVISIAMKQMAENVNAASTVVDKTLSGLSERIGQFSNALDRFAGFREAMQQHETSIIEVLRELRIVAEKNSEAAGQLADSTHNEKIDILNALRELTKPVSDSADKITEISAGFALVCESLARNLAASSEKQTGVLTNAFACWQKEINQEAGAAKRSLDNLKVPFEQSAETLREQTQLSILQMSTLAEELKSELTTRASALLESLSVVVQPLRELAAHGVSTNGSGHPPEKTTVHLSAEDWNRIERIFETRQPTPAANLPSPKLTSVRESQRLSKTAVAGEGDASFADLTARLGTLDVTLRELATTIQRQTRPNWIKRIAKRVFKRKDRPKIALDGSSA